MRRSRQLSDSSALAGMSTIPPSEPKPELNRPRCEAHRHGHRCLLDPGHEAAHMGVHGPFFYWDKGEPLVELADRSASALLWVDWARKLGIDAVKMQLALLACCRSNRIHPSAILLNLLSE